MTQNEQILAILKKRDIDSFERFNGGLFAGQLPRCIDDLKKDGHNIIAHKNKHNKGVTYVLLDGSQPQQVKTSASNQSTVSKKKTKKEHFSFKVDELKYDPEKDCFYYTA